MYSIKEKVTEKLSRLFADSPNNSVSSPYDDPQARSYSKGGKSLTSFFSFISPLASSDGSKTSQQHRELKKLRSIPCRQISDDFDQKIEPADIFEECRTACSPGIQNNENSTLSMNKQGSVSVDDDDKDCACGSTSSDSDAYAEATDLPSPTKLLSNLREDSVFITSELYEFLQSSIPNLVKGCQWVLLYSTLKHGISLRTLIRKSADLSGPCLLVVGDRQGAVFGGLLECPLKPTPKRKYQGTNRTFVFTTIYGEPRLFRPTGANRYYYMCLNDLLAFGGGGNFALCLDGDLLSGTSGACDTFGNLCLAHNEDFELKNVELWGFSHVSQHLT
ncbi:hypothetical protein AB3S75_046918 [Citrus x aurantiifolia]